MEERRRQDIERRRLVDEIAETQHGARQRYLSANFTKTNKGDEGDEKNKDLNDAKWLI